MAKCKCSEESISNDWVSDYIIPLVYGAYFGVMLLCFAGINKLKNDIELINTNINNIRYDLMDNGWQKLKENSKQITFDSRDSFYFSMDGVQSDDSKVIKVTLVIEPVSPRKK